MCSYRDRRSAEVAQPVSHASLVFETPLPQTCSYPLIRSSRKPLYRLSSRQGRRDVGLFDGRAWPPAIKAPLMLYFLRSSPTEAVASERSIGPRGEMRSVTYTMLPVTMCPMSMPWTCGLGM